MTFYEAALQILQREGRALHADEITALAIKENLLSHVGMQPERTMASRLAAMARRSQDRRLVVVEPDTFGLTDWDLKTVPEALEASGLPEQHDEEEPLLRGRERHPKVDKENVRVAGRSDRRRKHEEFERRKKKKKRRLPALPELVFEVLDRAGRALPLFDLAAAIRDEDLVVDDLGREALEAALRAENEKRAEDGRAPAFVFPEGGLVFLPDRSEPEEEVDLAALALEVVGKVAKEHKPAVEAPAAEAAVAVEGELERFVAEARKQAVRALRQRLAALEVQQLEGVASSSLAAMGYREIRQAKRHKDGGTFTCRRRMGLVEVRFAVRVIRGGRDVRREDVTELRKDLGAHGAQVGVLFSPSDVTREGRSEASLPGQPLISLLCADALADQLVERGLGAVQQTVTIPRFSEASLRALLGGAPGGEAEVRVRESREDRKARRERERREWRERREREREERRKAREAAAAELKTEVLGAAEEPKPKESEQTPSLRDELATEVLGSALIDEAGAVEGGEEARPERRRRRRRRGRGGAGRAAAEGEVVEGGESLAPEELAALDAEVSSGAAEGEGKAPDEARPSDAASDQGETLPAEEASLGGDQAVVAVEPEPEPSVAKAPAAAKKAAIEASPAVEEEKEASAPIVATEAEPLVAAAEPEEESAAPLSTVETEPLVAEDEAQGASEPKAAVAGEAIEDPSPAPPADPDLASEEESEPTRAASGEDEDSSR